MYKNDCKLEAYITDYPVSGSTLNSLASNGFTFICFLTGRIVIVLVLLPNDDPLSIFSMFPIHAERSVSRGFHWPDYPGFGAVGSSTGKGTGLSFRNYSTSGIKLKPLNILEYRDMDAQKDMSFQFLFRVQN